MLSVGSREDARRGIGPGLGFGGEMEENELEEGEAFSGQEGESPIDPDVALSYIGDRLQDVLGHFQKDFEGGVSVENLGSKFGGYGSFLPTHQRSPSILSHPRSPQRAPNNNAPRSPCNPPVEGARQNPTVPTSASVPLKNNSTSTAPPLDSSRKKETCRSTPSAGEFTTQFDLVNKPAKSNDPKILKVRIKVGSDNVLARNNAEIYSGLGLDISPSSSPEYGPAGSGGFSSEIQDVPDETPMTVFQIMTCFPILGGYFLSPLHDSLLHLMENERPYLKDCNLGALGKLNQESCNALVGESLPARDGNFLGEKKIKSVYKNARSSEKSSNGKDGGNDIAAILKKEIGIETPTRREVVSNAVTVPIPSSLKGADEKADRQFIGKAVKVNSLSRDPIEVTGNDKVYSPDIEKEETLEIMASNRVGNVSNDSLYLKGKLNSITGSTDKSLEGKACNQKNILVDPCKEGRGRSERNYDALKSDIGGLKGRKDDITDPAEPVKIRAPHKAIACEQDGEKIVKGKDQISGGKRKSKEGQTNGTLFVELPKENLKTVFSMPSKEKKKSSHSRGDHSENNRNALKSHKESSRGISRECDRDVVGDTKVDQMGIKTDSMDILVRNKPTDTKLESEGDTLPFAQKLKERSDFKKAVNPLASETSGNISEVTPLMGNGANPVAVPLPSAPVVIEEHWVCCDKCQKWRLLPYGTNPDHLPKKWLCSMLTWLPGMNRCNISEKETTRALNALYQIPMSESHGALNGPHSVSATGKAFADGRLFDQNHDPGGNVPGVVKKKHGIKDASHAPSDVTQLSSSVKKTQQVSIKSRSLNDVNHYPMEPNSSIKSNSQHESKSTGFIMEKHTHKLKEKPKSVERYSDGGDFIEQSGKPLKSKSKREFGQDGLRVSKKVKVEGAHNMDEDWGFNNELTRKTAPIMGNDLSTKFNGKNSLKYNENSSSKDSKCNSKDSLPVSRKKAKAHVQVSSNGDFREHFSPSDAEKPDVVDVAAKKRKVKEWQEDQVHPETVTGNGHPLDSRVNDAKEETSESDLRKEKKTRVKSEGKESGTSKMDDKMERKGQVTRVLLSSSRDRLLDGMEEEHKGEAEKEQRRLHQVRAASERNLDALDSLKRESGYAQLSTAATSSSSKVSGSHKSKANFQEARGSPVDSVSSSPLRLSNTEKVVIKKNMVGKDGVVNVGLFVTGSPRRYSDGEVDGGNDRSGTIRKEKFHHGSLESYRAADSGFADPMTGSCDYQDREATQKSGGKAKDGMPLKAFARTHDGLSLSEFEGNNMVSGSVSTSDLHKKHLTVVRGKDDGYDQEKLKNHTHASGTGQGKSSKCSSRPREKHRSSKSDVDKGKDKISDSFSEQEDLYSTKNGSSSRYDADIDFCDRYNYHKDSKDEKFNFLEKKDEKERDIKGKWSSEVRRENHSNSGTQENLDPRGSSLLAKQQNDLKSRAGEVGALCGKGGKSYLQDSFHTTASHGDEKLLNHSLLDRPENSEMAPTRAKSQALPHSGEKQDLQIQGPRAVPTVIQGNRSEVLPTDGLSSDASKALNQPRKLDNQNGTYHVSVKHPTPNGLDAPSPVRKDGSHSSATAVLKEARLLKHSANRLKNEGLAKESTGLYFEAALKFLHVASLLESSGAESSKHGETTQSMSMYSDTAKLCEFCAHEFEKCKEMAAAALAYKCMEVAYMKVVFSKHSSASKDRHELQTTLLMVPPGESPSSSASDVDNLNNQATLEKAASAKGVSSPQIVGNHVIAARNRPSFVRQLNYVQDVNYAMEASRKSQIALAAATVNLEEGCLAPEAILSVRRVLDLNFHDVEGLLHLVRVSMKSIGR